MTGKESPCLKHNSIQASIMNLKRIKILDTDTVVPIPKNYKDCITLLKSDYFRIGGGKNITFLQLWVATFRNHCFRYNFWLRLSAHKGVLYPFCKWMLHRCSIKYGLDIPSSTIIGYGLYIGHGYGIIVNPTAIIGNNVNLSQFTTIGSNEGKAAVIGDNVYIGPGVCIVEDVKIGSNVCIGAGAVVTKDIPSGSTAAGVPAKVIGVNKHEDYILNKWICQ